MFKFELFVQFSFCLFYYKSRPKFSGPHKKIMFSPRFVFFKSNFLGGTRELAR